MKMPSLGSHIPAARLKSVETIGDAVSLFAQLGYDAPARPVDTQALDIRGIQKAVHLTNSQRKRSGYGVLIGQSDSQPRSLRPLARSLQREIHDHPLGILGVTGPDGRWTRMVVFRPRQVGGTLSAVTVSRLDIDLGHPTGHDSAVISSIAWRSHLSDADAQGAIDAVLSVSKRSPMPSIAD